MIPNLFFMAKDDSGRGYRNRLALPAGETHPDVCWKVTTLYNDALDYSKETAKNIVEEAMDCYQDDESLAILAENLRHQIQTRIDVVAELRREWWGPKNDDPLRTVSLATWMQAIASYAQIVDLLSRSISHLVVAYEDEALIFQGRRYVLSDFSYPMSSY